jgi:Ca2+-binding EF-hand superfamily protein
LLTGCKRWSLQWPGYSSQSAVSSPISRERIYLANFVNFSLLIVSSFIEKKYAKSLMKMCASKNISLQEFLLAINVTSSGTAEQKLKWAFRMYDIDGNGHIDLKEMIKIIKVTYLVKHCFRCFRL